MSSGAGKVIRVGRAQEAEAIQQHLDHAFADDFDIAAGELFEDGEHQFLLAQDRGVFDFVFLGQRRGVQSAIWILNLEV